MFATATPSLRPGPLVHLLTLPPLPPPPARRMSPTASRRDPAPRAPEPATPAAPAAVLPDEARVRRDAELASLVQAAADGDCTAFEAFYDRTLGYAQAVAGRMLHGADLEDLLADAYFEAWRCAARFDAARGSAVTWLLTIVRSRSLDQLRHRAARPETADAEAADLRADEGADPVDALWRRQSGQRLHAALAGLDARERWTLGLAYFHDRSHSEIAAITGMPLGTVKSLLSRAQAKLRQMLGAGTEPRT